ncbi:MAG: 16S rRNA (uracil(1498)-N(3))-methyltransferase [Opitutaceae bacterium]|nr:16S rRNA (uracil(1498)-N(3))-methyltransferase [Opitutaceae bacterium]
MNLILFEPNETTAPLSRIDPRARHILDVLRRSVGDTFDAGLINGPRGKGTLTAINPINLTLTFAWGSAPPPLDPITLLLGLPRPQTARKILQEAAALGVQALHFFRSEKGETSYAQSKLWSSGEWRHHLIAGAAQAFDTRLPALTHGRPLAEILSFLSGASTRLALDNYEASTALSSTSFFTQYVTSGVGAGPERADVILALGPERGWSAKERDLLRAHGFALAHLGSRVLRTETAVVVAVTLVRARLGIL